MAKAKIVIKEIEKVAPKSLKEDYDNVGLMVGNEEKEVSKVLLSLDCTNDVVKEAISLNCDMIITHHPLFFRKPKSIVSGDLLGNKVIELIKNDINLYSCHTNLDSCRHGINEILVKMLGFDSGDILEPNKSKSNLDAGIGRLVKLDIEVGLYELVENIKNTLHLSMVRVAEGNRQIKTIAIINGSGQDLFEKAKNCGADCIITGDTTYHFVSDYKEEGISIIDAGHFGTEFDAFIGSLTFLKDKFHDIEFIVSKESKDPYRFI